MRQASSSTPASQVIRAVALTAGVVAALIVVGGSVALVGVPSPWSQAAQTVGAFGGAWALASIMGWDASAGRRDAATMIPAVVGGLGLAVCGVGLLSLVVAVSPAMHEHVVARSPALERLLRPDDPSWIPVVVVVVAVLPGVFEERWFRGVVRGALPGLGGHGRALVVACLFAAAHLDPANLGPLVVVGYGFGLIAERSGGWAAPAAAHFAHNACNGVVVPRVVQMDVLPPLLAASWAAAGGTLFVVTLLLWRRGTDDVDDGTHRRIR